MIAKFANEQEVKLQKPAPVYIEQCNSINTTITVYFKQSTALKNKVHSFNSMGIKVIGEKTVILLIVATDGFKRFENAKFFWFSSC